MISRRGFLGLLGGLAAAPIVEPIARTFFLPPSGGWVPAASGLVVPDNHLLSVEWMTAESLRILNEHLTFTGTLKRQYDEDFAMKPMRIGDTLNIRVPYRFSEKHGR